MTEEADTIEELEPVTLEAEPEPEADDAPVVITLGDEPEPEEDELELPEEAPKWAKGLRETAEERRKRIRELERENRELKARAAPVEEEVALGPKPNLLDPDIDGDEEIFEQRLLDWHSKAKEVEAKKEAKRREIEEQEQAWQAKVQGYQEAKAKLRVADFEDAEEVVRSLFDETQQAILIQYARSAPELIYAIGKHPERASEMAAIKNYGDFIAATVTMDLKELKVTTRKPAAKPESVVTSTARGSSSVDNHLERLRDEAAKTGDYTKVLAYRKQLKGKA